VTLRRSVEVKDVDCQLECPIGLTAANDDVLAGRPHRVRAWRLEPKIVATDFNDQVFAFQDVERLELDRFGTHGEKLLKDLGDSRLALAEGRPRGSIRASSV
jgi:hypothetical protein